MINHNLVNKNHVLFIILSIIFILLTNNYSENSVFLEGSAARSGEYYLSIADNSPLFSEEINYHHAQRFLIPYFIGLLSKLFNINTIFFFKFFTYLNFILIFFINLQFCNLLKINLKNEILIFGLIIFNPYISRYFILYPSMVVDLFFILSGYILILFFITKKKLLLFLSIFLAVVSRQTGIFFLVGIFLANILYLKYKEKPLINIKDIIILSVIIIISYFLSDWYLHRSGYTKFPSSAYLGLLNYFKLDFDLKELTLFLTLPLLSLSPILLLLLNEKINKQSFKNKFILLAPLIISLLIISQPILAGPLWTGKNIIRLSTLCSPFLIFIFLKLVTYKAKIEIYKIVIIIFIMITWSLHPTFSKVNIFKFISIKQFLVYKI